MIVRISCFILALATGIRVGYGFAFHSNTCHNNLHRIHPSSSSSTETSSFSSPWHVNQRRSASNTASVISPTSTSLFSTKESRGVTSTLISQLAVVALKLRLTKQAKVSCDVSASSKKLLLQSTVGPVTVKGRDWSSPLGLTCRAIEANVDTCRLDMNSVVNRRKLVLVTPAVGRAMIALDDTDFGNFLNHPLLFAQSPTLSSITGATAGADDGDAQNPKKFVFCREGVEIQKDTDTVIFYGTCLEQKWRCELRRGVNNGPRRAIIDVSLVSQDTNVEGAEVAIDFDVDATSMELTMLLGQFFNDIVFELDGTFLTFQDFKIHQKASDENATLLMALGITVKKFPSPGLAF